MNEVKTLNKISLNKSKTNFVPCPSCFKNFRSKLTFSTDQLTNNAIICPNCEQLFIAYVDTNGSVRGTTIIHVKGSLNDKLNTLQKEKEKIDQLDNYRQTLDNKIPTFDNLDRLISTDIMTYESFLTILFSYYINSNVLYEVALDHSENINFEIFYLTMRMIVGTQTLKKSAIVPFSNSNKKIETEEKMIASKNRQKIIFYDTSNIEAVSIITNSFNDDLDQLTPDLAFFQIFKRIETNDIQFIRQTYEEFLKLSEQICDYYEGIFSRKIKKIINASKIAKITDLSSEYLFSIIKFKIDFLKSSLLQGSLYKEDISPKYLKCIENIKNHNFSALIEEKEKKRLKKEVDDIF